MAFNAFRLDLDPGLTAEGFDTTSGPSQKGT
jgi:hypothetical protein